MVVILVVVVRESEVVVVGNRGSGGGDIGTSDDTGSGGEEYEVAHLADDIPRVRGMKDVVVVWRKNCRSQNGSVFYADGHVQTAGKATAVESAGAG
ncbi:hypothetical protein Tco_1312793 [Tanacetum coccineum]